MSEEDILPEEDLMSEEDNLTPPRSPEELKIPHGELCDRIQECGPIGVEPNEQSPLKTRGSLYRRGEGSDGEPDSK
jgi:hypothetical protein